MPATHWLPSYEAAGWLDPRFRRRYAARYRERKRGAGEARMTIDRMQEAIEARPFRAFKLCFASGTDVLVPQPDLVWIHPKNPRTVVVGLPSGGIRVVDLLLVEALEFEPTGSRGGHNGASRRRRS